jgi:ferrous iron transport protein A
MSLSLRDLVVGERGKITSLQKGNKAYRAKLLAMGLLPGTEFSVTRYAPMGDPVEIRVRGFSLSLRKDEADVLLVDKL